MGPLADVAAAQDIGRAFATGSGQARRRARVMACVLMAPFGVLLLTFVAQMVGSLV